MTAMGKVTVHLLLEVEVPIEAGCFELGGTRSAIVPLTLSERAQTVTVHHVPHDMALDIVKHLEIRLIKEAME